METNTLTFASDARVPTDSASRYIGQLCKHFAHKITATWSENYDTGRVEFPMGACDLKAGEGFIAMHAVAANETDLARLEDVVARHLERFMFREPQTIAWTKAA